MCCIIAVDKATDYQGRSWLEPPRSETQLRSDTPPDKCFLPKVRKIVNLLLPYYVITV